MSAGTRYRHLFTPLRIGPVTVPNRIVFSAHLTNYAEPTACPPSSTPPTTRPGPPAGPA